MHKAIASIDVIVAHRICEAKSIKWSIPHNKSSALLPPVEQYF